jgi:glycosyltransferase involved in cell wall biosynthesis
LKTLHLTNSWAETSGGIATFYRALIAESNRRGHPIRLIVPGAADRVQQVGEFGKIYHVQAPKAPVNPKYRMIYPSRFLLPTSRIQEILASERPDLIEICDKYALQYLGAMIRNRLVPALDYRPILVGLSHERMDDNVRAYFRFVPWASAVSSAYMKWLYFPFFDHHIANSEYTAGELRAVADGHLAPRGTWIRSMGVDLDHLSAKRRNPEHRRRLLQNFGIQDGVLLLYAGRVAPEKNLSLLFQVITQLAQDGTHNYRLLVVGDGVEREMWQRTCETTIPGCVVFMGHVRSQDVLADIYANADVFVHPNPREPFGIAPLEAMASGLPLVAPNTGGITSYANSQNAWTVNADVDSFADAIREVVTHPTDTATKTENALIAAQQYRWDRVAASFLELYGDLNRDRHEIGQQNLPAFYSSSAGTVRASVIRGAANLAVAGFRLWSRLSRIKPAEAPLALIPAGSCRRRSGTENEHLPA